MWLTWTATRLLPIPEQESTCRMICHWPGQPPGYSPHLNKSQHVEWYATDLDSHQVTTYTWTTVNRENVRQAGTATHRLPPTLTNVSTSWTGALDLYLNKVTGSKYTTVRSRISTKMSGFKAPPTLQSGQTTHHWWKLQGTARPAIRSNNSPLMKASRHCPPCNQVKQLTIDESFKALTILQSCQTTHHWWKASKHCPPCNQVKQLTIDERLQGTNHPAIRSNKSPLMTGFKALPALQSGQTTHHWWQASRH